MKQIGERIHTWSFFSEEKKLNFNGFLLRTDEGVLVVDPPPLSPDDEASFEKLGLWPDWIVITNKDHVRDRAWYLARKPTPTIMSALEAKAADLTPEKTLEFPVTDPVGKEERDWPSAGTLPGGLVPVPVPGKTPGEFAIHWEEQRILIVGDVLIGDPAGSLRLVPPAKISDPSALKTSLNSLGRLAFDSLLVADGEHILTGAKEKVSSFVESL